MEKVSKKETNRFKFIPFSERISNINIDVFHRVPHPFEDEESTEQYTYFHGALIKWTTLNLTGKWKAFRKEIGYDIQTLPQLLHAKEKIIDIFLKNIRLQDELSLQPVLELMVALVKDLRHEFYPFYPKVLKELIHLLKVNNAVILESTFTCLAYIFKYLFRELVKDLDMVLLDLAPLLNESNPEYVRDFAAQSFSFVARKVKNKEKLVSLVLYAMQTSPEVAIGCGQLLFEMMKGIKGQTHSSAEELFLVLLNSLGKKDIPQKTLIPLCSQVVTTYGNNIAPQYSILFNVLIKVLKSNLEKDDKKCLKKLLKITRMALKCQYGRHLKETNISEMVSILVKSLSEESKIQEITVGICADLLNLKNVKLPQEYASTIITKVMQLQERKYLIQFVAETSNSCGFESSIFPKALQTLANADSVEFFQILTKIVGDKINPMICTKESFDSFPKYCLPVHSKASQIVQFALDILKGFKEDSDKKYSEKVLYSLILVRHFEPADQGPIIFATVQICNKLINSFKLKGEKNQIELLILCVALETLLYFKSEYRQSNGIDVQSFLDILPKKLKNDKSLLGLKCLDLFLSLETNLELTNIQYQELQEIIQEWLLSAQSTSRLLALHSLQKLAEFKLDSNSAAMVKILQDALDAEIISPTVFNYRSKLILLEKLNFERLGVLREEDYKVLLKYLLGVLHVNFQLLWDPISRLIASYSFGMDVNSFWDVFFSHLRTVTAYCKGMACREDYTLPDLDEYIIRTVRLIRADDKADYENYKNLMWTTMALFPEVCDIKNKDIISIYLPFIENEVLKTSMEHSLTINIKKNTSESEIKENLSESIEDNLKTKASYKSIIRCAICQLTVISKFKNLKKCHREKDLRNTFLALLIHRDLDIQKKALECLFNYKFDYIIPYKQHLLNLIDETKFKDELVHFQVGVESGGIKEVHRAELMPIVMRILYGKMLFQKSTPRGNKCSANFVRRTIILRFLAGISHLEMETFLKMAFKKWASYCETDVFPYENIMNSIDLEKVPLPKKLQNTINLINIILNSFGGLMSNDLKRFIFKILLSVGSYVSGILAKRDEVYPAYLVSLKNLKSACLDFIIKFFEKFQKFPWREDDINALFQIFIWPNISKLPVEGIHGPTGLLRLFLVWSTIPRYFKLLARYDGKNEKMTPLPYILDLLINEKAENTVTSCIGTILENLLTLEEEEEKDKESVDEEREVPLDIKFILSVNEEKISKINVKEDLNYGSKLLFPHVGKILSYLRRSLEKSESIAFGKSQMTVLSRISEMATTAEHGDALMSILIKLMSTRRQMKDEDDDILIIMMTTVENLSNIVQNPGDYLRQLAVLFGIIELKQARKILVNVVGNMENRFPELSQISMIVRELNAFDEKKVDEPDFDRRLDAFKKIKLLADDKKLNDDLAFITLHNCFYFVRCEPDISLRDSASYYLKEICPQVALALKSKGFLRQIWIENILNLCKKGVVSTNENIQTLSISLLGVMARECGNFHPVLKDLSVLTNKLDPEVDFFENAQHLQIYRRLRALQKFSVTAKTLKKPPLTRTLVHFILPLATRYLACTKYAGKNSLIDSAIEAVATVCRFLPWQQYQTILRFYLNKLGGNLEFQKQLTRIVTAILNSFHFNISNAPAISENEADIEKTSRVTDKGEKNFQCEVPKPTDGDKNQEEKENIEDVSLITKKSDINSTYNRDISGNVESALVEKIKVTKDEIPKMDKELAEELVDVLEKETEGAEVEVPEENDNFAIDVITKLKPNAALKVEKAISGSLLEQLFKIMTRKSQIESTHKLNYKGLGPDREEEDLLKIPLAVTLVKLLQKLPERMLNYHLPGIFMRLCTFLKSRVESIRRITRETMQQILFALGPKYLPFLLAEMSASLTKGFQVHVQVYTIHSVIQHIHSLLKPGDIDANLPVLLEACKADLFGSLAEEKEVVKIQAKHKEAKYTKSYHLINLIAQCLTEKCLTDLILPVKEVLETSYSHKNIIKCREYLRQVTLGLSANQFITFENLFIYIYGTTSESIPQLMPRPIEPPKKKNPKEKVDCYIIPPEPKNRFGISANTVKKGSRSNAHIIVEFGFSLLHTILKKEKLKNCDRDIRCFLDPIAPILVKSLESQNVKVSTYALQCLSKFIKYDLPSLKADVEKIVNCLFSILHKYAAAGLCKGTNFDLVLAAFKAVSILIRETDYHGITNEQLKILLLYTEQDIYDNSRQATAFTLLRTILKKKLNSPELHELMKKVANLSITSELAHVRQQARQNVFHYIMDYPLKSQLEEFIGFYTSQLNFSTESGRQSSLDMMKNFIMYFPMKKLEELSGVFLLTLGASLINDNSANCKKVISSLLKSMLLRLDQSHRDQIFDILMVWFEEKKLTHQRLAAQIAGIFPSVEKEYFENRLSKLLPIIQKQFLGDSKPGQFVRHYNNDPDEERRKDNHYFQVLQLIMKICTNCPNFLTCEKYQQNVYFFTEISQSFLCHAHEWIRLAGAQFLGHVFNSCEPSQVSAVLNNEVVNSKLAFLEPETLNRRIKSLILDHCAQFIPNVDIGQEFLDQCVRNLVYLGRILSGIHLENEKEKEENDEYNEEDDDGDAEKPKLSFLWMTKRMRRIVNMELGQNSSSKVLRTAVFKWIGAIAMCSSRKVLKSALYHLMAPVVREREFTDLQQTENPFKTLVNEVSGILKKKVGVEVYSKEAIKIKNKLMERRMERKNKRVQEFVLDPERAAQKKIERQKKKREARKRKQEQFLERKGYKFKKRRKMDYK